MSDSNISAILANLGSKLSVPKINDSVKKLITGKVSAGGKQAGYNPYPIL